MKRYTPISKKKEKQRIYQSFARENRPRKELHPMDRIAAQAVAEMKKAIQKDS